MSHELKMLLCDIVKQWKALKVPYEHRGTSRNGCDCTGLIIGALKEMGFLKNYKLRNYPPDWNLHGGSGNYIVEEINKVADRTKSPGPGDVVLFNFGRCVSHAGLIIEHGLFIHCHKKGRKCGVSGLWNSPWTGRIFGFYRLDESRLNGF